MTQATFQGRVIHNEPAFRPRPLFLAGYHKFRNGEFEAFVALTALEQLADDARRAAPNEMIGTLIGRPFQDSRGVYAIVTQALTATSARCGPVTVETSFDDERQLLETLRSDFPIADKMGWFHSHPFLLPSYSPTDRENQRFWKEPFHLGLLACLDRGQNVTIFAFRGPESEPIDPPYSAGVAQQQHAPTPTCLAETHARTEETAPPRQIERQPCRPGLEALHLIVGLMWPIAFLIGMVIVGQAIRELKAEILAQRPTAAGAAIGASCDGRTRKIDARPINWLPGRRP